MSHKPISSAQVPIVGQPFTIKMISLPVNLVLTCHCGGISGDLKMVASDPATCPDCGRMYFAVFDPSQGKVNVQIVVPEQKAAS